MDLFKMCSATLTMSQIILSALVFTLIVWAFYEAGAFLWRRRVSIAKFAVTVWSLPETLHQRLSNN
jgi:hypothetical protein